MAIMFSEYYFYLVGFIEDINKEEAFENPDNIFPTIYRIDRIQELKVLEEHLKVPYAKRFEEGEFRKCVQFIVNAFCICVLTFCSCCVFN